MRYRFERGIDPESIETGLDLASQMIKEMCGGDFGSIVSDSVKSKNERINKIEYSFFDQVLGIRIDNSFVNEKLKSIGCRSFRK